MDQEFAEDKLEFSEIEDFVYSSINAKKAQFFNDEFDDIPHIRKRSGIYTDYLQSYVSNFKHRNIIYSGIFLQYERTTVGIRGDPIISELIIQSGTIKNSRFSF